jgi:hypothetical protein
MSAAVERKRANVKIPREEVLVVMSTSTRWKTGGFSAKTFRQLSARQRDLIQISCFNGTRAPSGLEIFHFLTNPLSQDYFPYIKGHKMASIYRIASIVLGDAVSHGIVSHDVEQIHRLAE